MITGVISVEESYTAHTLNTDKIKDLEDCKKLLKFLCDLSVKPLLRDVEYNGFLEVKEYFD